MTPKRAPVIYSEPIRRPGKDTNLEKLKAANERLTWQLAALNDITRFMLLITIVHITVRITWYLFN